MPDDMDEMEARLAAFIDGTLPPAQRAEIEAYLKANPSHAKLIAELQSIKAAVATLPREKAPAEVLDTLQSHLERHSLLSDEVEQESVAVRINNWWPQVGAVAALLMLAAGLGLLIYQVLPSGQPSARQMALLHSSASRPDEAGDGVSLGDLARHDEKAKEEKIANQSVARLPAARERGVNANVSPYQNGTAVETQQNQTQLSMAQQSQTADSLAATPAITAFGRGAVLEGDVVVRKQSDPMVAVTRPASVRVLIVSTDDPALTANLVAGGLAADGVRFERLTPPGGPAATLPTTSLAVRSLADSNAPAYPLAAITLDLQTAGDLPGDKPPAALYVAARPVLVPAASHTTQRAVRAMLDHQRPGRQSTKLVDWPTGLPKRLSEGAASTSPSTVPVAKATLAISATTPTAGSFDSTDAILPPTRDSLDPATRPTTASADVFDAAEPAKDLLVLILPQPIVTATQPTTTQPTTAPATRPMLDEVP